MWSIRVNERALEPAATYVKPLDVWANKHNNSSVFNFQFNHELFEF